ncbi:MAG: acylphosphatase [Deltaproteobacteria bacterium]|nr:acylphosphatase [Deltaproteobacteria bacterium]
MAEIIHIVVHGRVQGVGFRYFTQNTASILGISGWVRNLPGGQVEVMARVTPSTKGRFLAALQKGPPMSAVRNLDITTPGTDTPCPEQGFTIRH